MLVFGGFGWFMIGSTAYATLQITSHFCRLIGLPRELAAVTAIAAIFAGVKVITLGVERFISPKQ